ncbi:hypothetical protein CDD81_1565 [Ophiocordyceps australis]|uniref:Uncharacterized protein n=1 Tax=Ophiocordyceps australis TaxID=1399860 RepID=A0A2C5XFB4_9HYPO|nr:hypothetical protein CDD81_1565 [Ophiocordyceps australis]
MASPSEADILTKYLLQPAPLTAIVSSEQWAALFPRSLRVSAASQLRSLLRDLQSQRNAAVIDSVAVNIAAEARRGAAMRAEVLRLRQADDAETKGNSNDGEVDMEVALFGQVASAVDAPLPRYSLVSIVPELDGAADALEAEIKQLEQQEQALLASVKQTVGDLSDLRYGKLANIKLIQDLVDGLDAMQQTCTTKSL